MSSGKEAARRTQVQDRIPLEDLNNLVMSFATERRIINGELAEIMYRPPLIAASSNSDIPERRKRPARDPAEADQIRARVNELAAQAYEDQQQYFRSLEAESSGS